MYISDSSAHGRFMIWSSTNEFFLLQGKGSGLVGYVKNQIKPERQVQKSDLAAIACNTKPYCKRAIFRLKCFEYMQYLALLIFFLLL